MYHVIGLSAHCFSEIHVNSTHFFYNIIQTTPAIGIVAYVPSALHQQPDGDKLRPILLSDCEITAQFGWIKHRRLPLPEQAAELLKEVKTLF